MPTPCAYHPLNERAALSSVLVLVICGTAGVLSGCGAQEDQVESAPPPGWDENLRLRSVEDLNSDPHILEFDLEARIEDIEILPGTTTPAWTYGGTVPGPLIRARRGDRLIVHFTNHLPESTSIHWHGLRLPNDMDGVPNVTQDPIEPGETFVYDFVLNDAGTFWYHPHINSAAQVGWGMYGAIVVEDPDDPDFGDELVLVLSDMTLADNGDFHPVDVGGEFGDLFGREGDPILINGKTEASLTVRAGRRQRWRVINAARSRYFQLGLEGHGFVRVGGDNGRAAYAEELEEPIIATGERSDLVLEPRGEPGDELQLMAIPAERGFGSTFNRFPEPIMDVTFADLPAERPGKLPEAPRKIELIKAPDAKLVELELTIDISEEEGLSMGINHIPFEKLEPLKAKVGETQIWHVYNRSDFAHPFHLHGYFFQVLDEDRQFWGVPEWKDSVDVPVGEDRWLAVHFDDRPGTWMYHCHILDHAQLGMMGTLVVSK